MTVNISQVGGLLDMRKYVGSCKIIKVVRKQSIDPVKISYTVSFHRVCIYLVFSVTLEKKSLLWSDDTDVSVFHI